jgi:transcriptional regulator with XRE-family HTH domain
VKAAILPLPQETDEAPDPIDNEAGDLEHDEAGEEVGPGRPVFVQLGSNLRQLRSGAGMTLESLAAAVDPADHVERSWIWGIEAARQQTGVLRALRLAGALGAPLERLTEGIFWNPGEVATTPRSRKGPSERLGGYFSVVSASVDAFEEPREIVVVRDRTEVASVIARNVKEARGRRHLLQRELGLADTAGPGLIEAGDREPELSGLLTIARSLEVPPWFLLRGMAWEPPPGQVPEPGRRARRSDFHANDDAVARLWRDDLTATEIAAELGITRPSVEGIVRRLRARGVYLASRSAGRRADAGPAEVEESTGTEGGLEDEAEATEELIALIAGNLRILRQASGLTLQQLAEAAETTHSPIWRAETHGTDLSLTNLLRLAGSLKTPLSTITAGISWDERRQILVADPEGRKQPPGAARILGANVRRLRRGLRLSQEDLAARIGTFRRHLSAIESGASLPKPITLLMLARGLEVEVSDLLEGTCDWYVRPLPPPEYAEGEEPPSKADRQELLLRLWGEGAGTREIAEALGSKTSTVVSQIAEMRAVGIDVPYRNPPQNPAQLGVRLRRRRRLRRSSAGARRVAALCPASCGHPRQGSDPEVAYPDRSRQEPTHAPRSRGASRGPGFTL